MTFSPGIISGSGVGVTVGVFVGVGVASSSSSSEQATIKQFDAISSTISRTRNVERFFMVPPPSF